MQADTTLYIHLSTMKILERAMEKTGKTRNQIIIMLLKRAMKDARKMARLGTTVRYQEDDVKAMWRTEHVRFREDEVDFFKDLRNVAKMSDSLLLALAARKYLKEIIAVARRMGHTDNYLYCNYLLSLKIYKCSVILNISWGIPENYEEWAPPT